jgi:uncharacterized protein with von Willebrand factor type A (vWA) domain
VIISDGIDALREDDLKEELLLSQQRTRQSGFTIIISSAGLNLLGFYQL